MKKINKLQINHERLIKNEELVSIQGGYDDRTGCCMCIGDGSICGYVVASTSDHCMYDCSTIGCWGKWNCW